MHLVTAAELRAIERQRIARKGIAGQELMELAGFATAEKMLTWRPDLQTGERRMIVLCGPGGNGGDGFVTARLLAERGWRVELYWFGAPERQPPDAAAARARWEAGGGETRPWSGAAAAVAQGMGGRGADAADVVLEALFGIGLSRPMPAEIVAALGPMLAPDRTPPAPALEDRTAAPRDGAAVVSVDMPSGLCADGGRPIGPAVQADMTMTFVAPKLGQFLLPGLSLCGELRFSRLIGSARPDRGGQAPRARLLREAPQGLSKEARAPWGHKYDHGHVLAVAGGVGKGGAARLAARGALRAGAGAVTVAPPPSALQENAARLDAIMLHAVADAAALAKALKARRIDAVALGMGLGVGERAREMALAALGSGAACVLDADALTSFAEAPEPLFEALNPKAVLTPHAGEFARLFPDLAARLREDAATGPVFSKVDAALAAAERAGCAVLLKGPDTVVASRDRGADVLPARGPARAPWLATAGSGDVLAGIVAGLMARGLEAFDAASSGAWLHARAARLFGPGLVAEDLPEMLPRAFAYLASDEVADDPL